MAFRIIFFINANYSLGNTSRARRARRRVSSLPMKSVSSKIWGPTAAPTRVTRKAFITLPTGHSLEAIHS